MSKESIIKMLKGKIKMDAKYNDSKIAGDIASWKYEMGVLITRNEAQQIVDLFSLTPQSGEKTESK